MSIVTEKFVPRYGKQIDVLVGNPDRGFRTETVWYVDKAAESENPKKYIEDKLDIYCLPCKDEKIRLDMIYTYLTAYRDRDLPKEALEVLQIFFNVLRARKMKIMLRFAYCDSFLALETGAGEANIARHIQQLRQLVARNADVIHTLQSGFVGAYGEWAPCYQMPPVNYYNVLWRILHELVFPSGLYYQLRLPTYKNYINDYKPYYDRIGIDSCAFFGEQTREGWESEGFQVNGELKEDWEQLTREAAYTPQDGELFVNVNLVETKRMVDGKEAILEMAHHRFTSFSCWHGYKEISAEEENTTVMYGWKQEEITAEWLKKNKIVYNPNYFKDDKGNSIKRNTFEFIRDHLGYQIVLQNYSADKEISPGAEVNIKVELKNYGFSAAFNMHCGFAILDSDNKVIKSIETGNPETWYSHDPQNAFDDNVLIHKVEGKLEMPVARGEYSLCFYLKNSMNEPAKVGNEIEEYNGYVILQHFKY